MEKYICEHELGAGGYGSVWRCKERETGDVVAIKWFKTAHLHKEALRDALREMRLLRRMRHRNVVRFIEAFARINGRLYMVMEHVEGTLAALMRSYRCGLPAAQAKLYMWQLCQAVQFLHRHKIFHRDLKPANILISSTGVVKLCDFGFARPVHPEETSQYTPYVVTRWYRPPEVLVGDQYGPPIDVWALGCIFVELLTGRPLLPGESCLDQLSRTVSLLGSLTPRHTRLMEAKDKFRGAADALQPSQDLSFEERFPNMSTDMLQVLRGCLRADPADRLTVEELLALPYFREVFSHMPQLAKINAEAYGPGEDLFVPPPVASSSPSSAPCRQQSAPAAANAAPTQPPSPVTVDVPPLTQHVSSADGRRSASEQQIRAAIASAKQVLAEIKDGDDSNGDDATSPNGRAGDRSAPLSPQGYRPPALLLPPPHKQGMASELALPGASPYSTPDSSPPLVSQRLSCPTFQAMCEAAQAVRAAAAASPSPACPSAAVVALCSSGSGPALLGTLRDGWMVAAAANGAAAIMSMTRVTYSREMRCRARGHRTLLAPPAAAAACLHCAVLCRRRGARWTSGWRCRSACAASCTRAYCCRPTTRPPRQTTPLRPMQTTPPASLRRCAVRPPTRPPNAPRPPPPPPPRRGQRPRR